MTHGRGIVINDLGLGQFEKGIWWQCVEKEFLGVRKEKCGKLERVFVLN